MQRVTLRLLEKRLVYKNHTDSIIKPCQAFLPESALKTCH
jgi:hypothetical protein